MATTFEVATADTVPAGVPPVTALEVALDPVKVCAATVRFGAVALQAVVAPVPMARFVAAQLPVVALVAFVPVAVTV